MKKKILIVDDEVGVLDSVSLILKMAGYEVETAKDGGEALNKILESKKKNELFDLIITDVLMPNLNGLELMDKLNQDKMLIPVIAITGHEDRKTRLQLILKGCEAYLIKPVTQEKLLNQVGQVLEAQKNQ